MTRRNLQTRVKKYRFERRPAMKKELRAIISKAGEITLPISKVDGALCLRVHLAAATDNKGREWSLSHSGAKLIIDVPNKHRHYEIEMEDIFKEIAIKEKAEEPMDELKALVDMGK